MNEWIINGNTSQCYYIQYVLGRVLIYIHNILFFKFTGEIYSFYLARLLDMKYTPPVALSIVDRNGYQWQPQGAKFDSIEWHEGNLVILTKFVEDLDTNM